MKASESQYADINVIIWGKNTKESDHIFDYRHALDIEKAIEWKVRE